MRPPAQVEIAAPMIPTALPWVNVASLRMDQQRGRPVLLEFSDLVRPSSLRSTAHLKAWHERYGADPDGLRVITVFAPWLPFSADEDVARALVERAGIVHPVLLDLELRLWSIYENEGWPCRYLFGRDLRLIDFHRGEGGYEDTERAIQEALGIDEPLTGPLDPIEAPGAQLVVPSPDRDGPGSGPYEAGEVWAVFEGEGVVTVNGEPRPVTGPGPQLLLAHDRHEAGALELDPGDGVTCHAVCFSPGLAP